jgi:hypothetical protein
MASWIVHLRIAEILLGRLGGLDPAAFAIGNIAPDSGIPDENWETFTPPPEVSHFKMEGDQKKLADLDFYRRHLQPLDRGSASPARAAFLLGYFCHLVTNNLWCADIYEPTHQRFSEAFAADPNFIWEVKRDWYGLDFEYVRSHPDSLFWRVFLDCDYEGDYLDFLPPAAVKERPAYIMEFYQRTDALIEARYGQRPGCYLTAEAMDAFVRESADRLCGLIDRYWIQGQPIPKAASALEAGSCE